MSKSSTRTSIKTNPKNEAQRKAAKSSTSVSPAAAARTTAARTSKEKVKQQDSLDSDKGLRRGIKAASSPVTATTTGKKPSQLNTSKYKEREPLLSKGTTTPSPTTKESSTLRAAKQPAAAGKAKPNAVLDTYHSVTVSSPPSKRRVQPKQTTAAKAQEAVEDKQQSRARTYSRTLQPEEIVVLKRDSAKHRSELEVQKPVAFEVNFEAKSSKPANSAKNESDNYSDDFDSYESDFETDASTPEDEEDIDEEEKEEEDNEVQDEMEENTYEQKNKPEQNLKVEANKTEKYSDKDDDDDDSEPTQNPITVIHRDKELERKLDSGHYELNSRHHLRSGTQQPDDSFDTISMANSEQLDSGISTFEVAPAIVSPTIRHDTFYGGYTDFVARPVITKRGVELMRKLRFDQLEYRHFDMKPLSYEGYMQSYGKLNTCQLATQTQSQQVDSECQTMELHTRTSWTQHPPHYGGQLVPACSGGTRNTAELITEETNDVLESSLLQLDQLRLAEQQRALQQQRQRLIKPNDMERLGVFLHQASQLIGKVLNAKSALHQPRRQVSLLQTDLLNALRVRRIFGGAGQQQLLVTVHECPPDSDVYRDDFANLLMVWSLTDLSKPFRLLSTWAEVCRVTLCSEAPDIIVAGLRDGSIAMWDLRETYSYCSKLDGHLAHFAATQSVVPCLDKPGLEGSDLGAVVDVRSFRSNSAGTALGTGLFKSHKEIQYASLNDSGLLTIWTLVKSGPRCGSSGSNEYSSPWARVKLLQVAICDVRVYLETRLIKKDQSAYNKTKTLFQGNVYSDELLRELNETQTLTAALAGQGLEGLRFSGIDTGSDLIYVCTNRNFVLCCTRSLKTERFTRIGLHESRFLFPTALCVLANEYFVAVGLSNGSVMILNCNQRQTQRFPQRPTTAMPQPELDIEPETGKSCAIQNIILNERRSFEQQQQQLEGSSVSISSRPDTAFELIHQPRRAYELRVFDQQLLLSGSVLRQHLVQALVQSSDAWHLFALSNGCVRIYDFHLDRERADAALENSSAVADIAAVSSSASEQKVLFLDHNGQVQMHPLNL